MNQSFLLSTQLNGFKYSKRLNIFIWLLDGTLAGTTTQGQNGPKSNSYEQVLHISQTLRLEPHHQM